MANWEYKLISSGPLGFASMTLLEQHLNQMGKEEWEIVNFVTKADNPLVFHGLARRPIARDWFPPAEAKPACAPPATPKEDEDDGKDERSFAEDLPAQRPANAPEPVDLGLGDFDDLAGSEEDLPTLFDALQPFLRRNPRGDLSAGLDFLAKKFEQGERELLGAFEECGLKTPERAGEKGEVVDFDGGLYWLERDTKGRVWINTREKKFKTTRGTPVAAEAQAEKAAAPKEHQWEQDAPPERSARPDRPARPEQPTRAERQERQPRPEAAPLRDADSFLGRIRSMMRRNRRGHGWSGSFPYLTKALSLDEAQLLAQLGELGLPLRDERDKPVFVEDGEFLFWLNKNHRGEIWINAKLAREGGHRGDERGADRRTDAAPAPGAAPVGPAPAAPAKPALPPENVLSAVRLLLQPKKRGEGVTAQVAEVATKLEKSEAQMVDLLASAGLSVPESAKAKPAFVEQGDEIFWLNLNPKGQVWINAKQSRAAAAKAAGKTRPKKKAE
ncbi:MAG: hypothetical protein HY302_02885 [Opitutae bacterium]|nr:hypothetical protein [Opitutae bacterium]